MTKTIGRKAGVLAALLALPAAAAAQGRCGSGEERGIRVPDLGFQNIWCSNCKLQYDDNGPKSFEFSSEPRVGSITAPGEGRLRERDVLVAVDGNLITTSAGAGRLASVRRGETVRLTVRRDGETRDVTIRAGERCMLTPRAPKPPTPPQMPRPPRTPGVAPVPPVPGAPPAPGVPAAPAIPAPPAVPAAPGAPPVPPAPPAPPSVLPSGWFGFGIRCDDCGWSSARRGERARFYFRDVPEVVNVESGSPAYRAGIRRGDRLTHVDGVSLTTPQGAARFQAIRPGETVTWTYQRGSRSHTARAAATRRPDARPGAAPRPAADAQRLRFSGAVGDAQVEVRGAPVTVTRDERTGELVIRSSDLIVRVKPEQER